MLEPESIWAQPVTQRASSAEATFTPTSAGLHSEVHSEPLIPVSMAAPISEAIKQGIAAGLQQRAELVVSEFPGPQDFHHNLEYSQASSSQASLSGEEMHS